MISTNAVSSHKKRSTVHWRVFGVQSKMGKKDVEEHLKRVSLGKRLHSKHSGAKRSHGSLWLKQQKKYDPKLEKRLWGLYMYNYFL